MKESAHYALVDDETYTKLQCDLASSPELRIIDVQVSTLRNWEQGRREPTGPAKALLRAIRNDSKRVLRALAG